MERNPARVRSVAEIASRFNRPPLSTSRTRPSASRALARIRACPALSGSYTTSRAELEPISMIARGCCSKRRMVCHYIDFSETALRQRTKQLAGAVPENLHADANEQKRCQPENHV